LLLLLNMHKIGMNRIFYLVTNLLYKPIFVFPPHMISIACQIRKLHVDKFLARWSKHMMKMMTQHWLLNKWSRKCNWLQAYMASLLKMWIKLKQNKMEHMHQEKANKHFLVSLKEKPKSKWRNPKRRSHWLLTRKGHFYLWSIWTIMGFMN
jgi:hypothetical protein